MSGPDLSSLYKVTKDDIEACARSLAEAFAEDKGLLQLASLCRSTEKGFLDLFRFIVRASLKYGYVYASSPDFEGVITWLPENVTALSEKDFWMSGGLGMILRNGFRMPLAMQKYEDFAHGVHLRNISEPHWYLLQLGVRKEHRKKGFSSRLMRPFLKYFDDNGITCYLETGEGNNEAMYRHYGFDLVEKIDKKHGAFKAMIRYPKGR